MTRIAGMSVVVKAEGVSEALYNRQRDRVVEAIRAKAEEEKAALHAEMDQMEIDHAVEMEIERDRADINTRGRSRLLCEKLDALHHFVLWRGGPVKRILRAVGNVYALIVGTAMCLPEIAENIRLYKRSRKEEYDEFEAESGIY